MLNATRSNDLRVARVSLFYTLDLSMGELESIPHKFYLVENFSLARKALT